MSRKPLFSKINYEIFKGTLSLDGLGVYGMEQVEWTWYRHEDCDECLYLEDLDPEQDGGVEHVFCMHEKRVNIQSIDPRPEPCPYFCDSAKAGYRPKPRSYDQQFLDLVQARVPEREPSPSESDSWSLSESPSVSPSGKPGKAVKRVVFGY